MPQKVSVIVPIYKVEQYIHRCIDSITNQSYHNLEIILVDDGSPDKCGEIAEAYAEIDPRIIVVHKQNGGLSDARNFGMQYVSGEFILFVDSDDWLDYEMIELLVTTSNKYKADIVQSAFFYAYDDHLLFDNRYHTRNDSPIKLDNTSLMAELVINERVKNFAWGKLYRSSLIKDIPFKNGVLFEDVFWAHHVMHKVDTYIIIHQPMYYYYQRDDSIVATYTPRNLDILAGLKARHDFIKINYIDLIHDSYKLILKTSLIHYNLLVANRKKDKGAIHRKKIKHYIQRNSNDLQLAVMDDDELKRQLRLFMIHPYLNLSYLLLEKLLRKLKLLPKPPGLERVNLKGVIRKETLSIK